MTKQEFKYDLTIGMIVKNEIKFLRRCLETLQPLREALSCELIITDTGSTDGTKEVAQEFADVYLEFEWCDDFAQARNTGTEIAQGRWFFYVDADNHFDESLLEIAHFLKRPEVDQTYDYANIVIRNYTDTAENLHCFFDAEKSWLLNFTNGIRLFRYPIHETIAIDGEKGCSLSTLMHHWGYLKNVVEDKQGRNLPLLHSLVKKTPKDLRARYQLLHSLADWEEKEPVFIESIKIGLPLTKKGEIYQVWVMLLRLSYLESLIVGEQWDKAQREIDAWTDYIPKSVFQIQFLGCCLGYYLGKGKNGYPFLVEIFPTYREMLFKQLQKPQVKYYSFHHFPFASMEQYALLESKIIQQALYQEDKEGVRNWLSKAKGYTYQNLEKKYPYIMTYCNFGFILEDYVFLSTLLDFVEKEGIEVQKELVRNGITNKYQTMSLEEKQVFFEAFKKNSDFLATISPPVRHQETDVTVLKETLLALLMEKRLTEANTLFLLLEQHSPNDPAITSLKPLFPPTNL